MLGTIGEKERMDSTVISDVVNIASRIQKYALENKYSVLLSEAVMSGLKSPDEHCVTITPLGEIKLRGRTRVMNLFEVSR
jgi:class 3 adenylate cyclase